MFKHSKRRLQELNSNIMKKIESISKRSLLSKGPLISLKDKIDNYKAQLHWKMNKLNDIMQKYPNRNRK